MRFEPLTALVAGDEGLADLAQIIREGGSICSPAAGCCWSMAGPRAKRCALFREAGYLDVATCRDYGDNERLTLGRLPDMENVG